MKHVFLFSILILISLDINGQQDSIALPKTVTFQQRVAAARLSLQHAFLVEDPAEGAVWLDSLLRLNDASHVALQWDERWLLYYWLENYEALLNEASKFDAALRDGETWKVQPPPDSLFVFIDAAIFEKRYDYFQSIRHTLLTEEEKSFSILLLEYLLRLNKNEEEWRERLDAFERLYPKSRFHAFMQTIKPPILKPANKGFGLSAHFLSGSWSAELERSLTPLYAAQIDLYRWVDRWNISASVIVGSQRLARDVTDGFDIWPKKDPASFASFGLEFGYDIINNSKVRLFPAIGGAFAVLGPPTDSETDVPDYYENFNYLEAHITASLTADAKLFGDDDSPRGSYHGVRMRVGHHWLNFKGQNKMLAGNMFFFSFGYNLFAFREVH
jgi:hypothetical protein